MNYLVVGAGNASRPVARLLNHLGHDVIVTDLKEIMAVEHIKYPIYGVQFHPESIMTPDGKTMLRNFIKNIAKC